MTEHRVEFHEDIMIGASEIASFLFGDAAMRRKVYHLAATCKYFPAFKLGSTLCVRRSVLLKWIGDQEGPHRP